MSGNTFGKNLKITTWGESHGPAIGVVIDGFPSNVPISEKEIQAELNKRKPVKGSKTTTSRIEEDKPKILSGIFEGKTTGMPISIVIENKNTRSQDYKNIKNIFRPGHADLTYAIKYGNRDYRGGGRSSGRETVARVAAGALAKKLLKSKYKTEIFGHTIQIGDIKSSKFAKAEIEKNELKCADKNATKYMLKLIEETRKEGDSIGAIIEIRVKNAPIGLGDPVFDKLDAKLGQALLSIGAIKGVEFGEGFKVATLKGSQNNDQMTNKKMLSNHAGGILGGISTGEEIIIRCAIKPPASISKPQKTITASNKNTNIRIEGRHDCCIAPRVIPVAESMIALVLADLSLTQ